MSRRIVGFTVARPSPVACGAIAALVLIAVAAFAPMPSVWWVLGLYLAALVAGATGVVVQRGRNEHR